MKYFTSDVARGTDCKVRFRDIFGVEHMIDYSNDNKTCRDPISIWIPVSPGDGKSTWYWYDDCGRKQ